MSERTLHGHPDGGDVLSCGTRRAMRLVSWERSERKERRDLNSPAFPTRGSKIRPTNALGTWNCSQVSSMEATRKSDEDER